MNNNVSLLPTTESSLSSLSSILDLIIESNWDSVYERCLSNPKEIYTTIEPITGRSPLHVACAIGSTPCEIIRLLAATTMLTSTTTTTTTTTDNDNDTTTTTASKNTTTTTMVTEQQQEEGEEKEEEHNNNMIMKHDKIYGDTPLHILCRNGQKTYNKVAILLHLCNNSNNKNKNIVLETNIIGGTPLHSACAHNAMIDIIQLIVQYNPIVLKQNTNDGISCLQALWTSYIQSIPGHLIIAKILQQYQQHQGEEVERLEGGGLEEVLKECGHFYRFWNKIQFLVLEYYKLTNYCPKELLIKEETITTRTTTSGTDSSSTSSSSSDTTNRIQQKYYLEDYLIHGLIHFNAPIQLLQVALQLSKLKNYTHNNNNNWLSVIDQYGNTPLHILIQRRPYSSYQQKQNRENEIIQYMVQLYPNAISISNNNGYIPLIIAIRNKISIQNGLMLLICQQQQQQQQQQQVDEVDVILSYMDPNTNFYPYQLAAYIGGPCSLNSTYQLLITYPELI